MAAASRARLFLVLAALLAASSVLIVPLFAGPLALLASAGAIWSGERRAGAALLFVSAGAMTLGMYLGCLVACT